MGKTKAVHQITRPAEGESIVVDVSKESPNWSGNQRTWPRYDPVRDIYLCESCWNSGNWKHHCALGFCECCRCNRERPKRVKFTGEGQTSLSFDRSNPIVIGPKS
jgi:hypothetical protein